MFFWISVVIFFFSFFFGPNKPKNVFFSTKKNLDDHIIFNVKIHIFAIFFLKKRRNIPNFLTKINDIFVDQNPKNFLFYSLFSWKNGNSENLGFFQNNILNVKTFISKKLSKIVKKKSLLKSSINSIFSAEISAFAAPSFFSAMTKSSSILLRCNLVAACCDFAFAQPTLFELFAQSLFRMFVQR